LYVDSIQISPFPDKAIKISPKFSSKDFGSKDFMLFHDDILTNPTTLCTMIIIDFDENQLR